MINLRGVHIENLLIQNLFDKPILLLLVWPSRFSHIFLYFLQYGRYLAVLV